MKIREAIDGIDELMHNAYSPEQKIEWLSKLEWIIKRQVIDTHVGGEDVSFSGFNSDTDLETELIAPAPWDEMYLLWLESKIHFANKEWVKYNNAAVAYNEHYKAFANWYNENHAPLGAGSRFLF